MSRARFLERFGHDEKGSTLIEIVVVIPILFFISMACVEVTRYVLFHQKLDKAVISLGDLTSQARTLNPAELASLTDAARQIMEPFDLSLNGGVVLSSVSAKNGNGPQVNWQWSDGAITSDIVPGGNSLNLPDGFVVRDNESVIVSEVRYNFTPLFMASVVPPDSAYAFSIHRPRFDPLTALAP